MTCAMCGGWVDTTNLSPEQIKTLFPKGDVCWLCIMKEERKEVR